ncbi:tRNA dihydrouridine synthase DusB [Aquamicrobium zhengzhouense]|uniref:tRNA-dihydrouridine synthase n=1 Tax=Aquamicrobium zhengzhouense TaxID=2781738 RepID=A0ABS0S9I7_9HYPH|nr:tRNA dihydrouridine synthase DusB [Aquamicrobium zhengzhouense]MBI1619464.1 tRNA dihydrouridine synthase DusB [Aquamicrobium zhengzhouense]
MTIKSLLAEPMQIGNVSIPNRVILAPMSGVTDEPFRRRAIKHGAGLVVSEMVASAELAKGRRNSELRIRRPDVPVHMVQLAGRDADWMAEGARIAAAEGADIIDINMGCPAKKVTGGYCGSALMKEPDHALKLIEAVVAAVEVPVTVKMRLGWDDESINAPDIAARAEGAGVAMLTIHGRTRCQFYKGKADRGAIRLVKDRVSIPVVANGDVADHADASDMLAKSGADAVMVGREHYGRPWLAGEIASQASGLIARPAPRFVTELFDYISEHYQDMLSLYGTQQGVRHARKHLGWYLDRHLAGVDLDRRQSIMTSLDPGHVMSTLRDAIGQISERSAT